MGKIKKHHTNQSSYEPLKFPDEDYSSTRGAMEGMLRYGDGDLPDLYAAPQIRAGGHKAH